MLKEYLYDIASTGSITHTRNLTQKFLDEWKGLLLEAGFTIDANGVIQNGPNEISDYQKAIEEYIILRCMVQSLEKNNFNRGKQNCCLSEWEHYNLPEDLDEKCRGILSIIADKFGNSTKTT